VKNINGNVHDDEEGKEARRRMSEIKHYSYRDNFGYGT
jgi:hypothetical protein